ncbi:TetR/AcrR family transcriptional regulator [Streptomyces sp. NPDC052023]|uniref:TetR/AcrR family transcriptional regulator n=1 Tax=Streptomyces sp. NPDC052023 TaxID=3365681 RepID=UPI0037D53751
MPKNRQNIPKEERQAEIVAKALELFLDRGYRGTSVAQIARGVGVVPAAVHWYFPTKDDLFAAALKSLVEGEMARIESDPVVAGDSRKVLVKFLADMEPHRALHREGYERLAASPALAEFYEQSQKMLDAHLLALVEDTLPEGTDAGPIVETMHVLFEGLLVSARRRDQSFESVIDLMVEALVALAVQRSQGAQGAR